ncbi:hypothetical protein B484DRAFT_404468, partial [Ochromonadaceae sp. CCMP2298]
MLSEEKETTTVVVQEVAPTYTVELAKSGRAECKRCDSLIANKSVRVGIEMDGEWGLFTRWQHLDCTVFHKMLASEESMDGFHSLDAQSKQLISARFFKSKDEIDEDDLPVNPDELIRKTWDQPTEPTAELLMPLLPYQKEGLGWMLNQEMGVTRGGILADEMGMGKTIQMLALMLANRPDPKNAKQGASWRASDVAHWLQDKPVEEKEEVEKEVEVEE